MFIFLVMYSLRFDHVYKHIFTGTIEFSIGRILCHIHVCLNIVSCWFYTLIFYILKPVCLAFRSRMCAWQWLPRLGS